MMKKKLDFKGYYFFLFFFLFLIKRMISSCINFACFLLACICDADKWSELEEESCSFFVLKQKFQSLKIGKHINVQKTRMIENGIGRYNLLGQSKNSIQTLVN